MSLLATAITDNTCCGLLKSASFQRVRVIPEGGQAQFGLPLLLFLLFLQHFWLRNGVVVAPVFRIVFQDSQPLEHFFIRAISNLTEQFISILLKVQQIIYIHQHRLCLLVFRLLQFLLESIESADTVWISFCLPKLLL